MSHGHRERTLPVPVLTRAPVPSITPAKVMFRLLAATVKGFAPSVETRVTEKLDPRRASKTATLKDNSASPTSRMTALGFWG